MPNLKDSHAESETVLPSMGISGAILTAEPESTSPMFQANNIVGGESMNNNAPQSPKQHRANVAKRLSGRPSFTRSTSSLYNVSSESSVASILQLDQIALENDDITVDGIAQEKHKRRTDRHLVSQIAGWLREEKAKRKARKKRREFQNVSFSARSTAEHELANSIDGDEQRRRSSSGFSGDSLALDKLEHILQEHKMLGESAQGTPTQERKRLSLPRRTTSMRKLRKASVAGSSDAERREQEALVPSAEVYLDNSKTLGYSGGANELECAADGAAKRMARDSKGWLTFKNEILRLTHTLGLKGWRKIPLGCGEDIQVKRLSGALTNAVYVVSPPNDLSQATSDRTSSTTSLMARKPGPKLLLRVYGPQVEHLIDRENELQILRRLARKRIGPRMLGTFLNGRFEEFFNARTLTARDLHVPETSKQIAKRMRELHDGIDLLQSERDAGPFVWRNWDKWVDRCEEIISWLDRQIIAGSKIPRRSRSEAWKQRGLVCGVEWAIFRGTVQRFREWLDEQYGGPLGLRERLVFAHNDTQYGNLLRLEPSGESPLLLPANEHKQLQVIDFEYASANVPGLEFANHFTEWCYDYHDEERSYALNEIRYPTPEEQRRFLKTYIQHRPQFHPQASNTTTTIPPSPGPSNSISSFMLDSRAPPAQYPEEEKRREQEMEQEIQRLMKETRLWRIANSAQWVAWGIMQATVPGMDQALEDEKNATPTAGKSVSHSPEPTVHAAAPYRGSDPLSSDMERVAQDARSKRAEDGHVGGGLRVEGGEAAQEQEADADEKEFDYLGYAQDRAMLFWGDVLGLGIVRKEELPDELVRKVKVIEY